MYQHELLGIMNLKMLQAIRYRDCIPVDSEQHGHWHGVYKAYEEMSQLLMMTDIQQTSKDSPAITPTD